ncbi:MAG: hypothetical protein H7246_11460 [Phycisphaerae bacterium]|nr:hypothetical protein [Saprospiraceae bacterium]
MLCSALAFCQSPTWPPGGTTPSPYAISLDGGRFLPSTKRWNLVWSDQIVPNWVSAAQVEFAAQNYVGTQKIFANQVGQFRQFNSNFLCLSYHLAVGLNPADNADCPLPHGNPGENPIGVVTPAGYVGEYATHFQPWLAVQGIAEGSPSFEQMFQHYDLPDQAHRVWHHDPYWLMNLADANWRKYQSETTISWMKGNQNEGTFFDVAVETYAYFYHPRSNDPTGFNWWQAPHGPVGFVGQFPSPDAFAPWQNQHYLPYFQKLYTDFHAGANDYLVMPNVDQLVTTVYDPIWLDGDANGETVDGAMMEGFGDYTGFDMWLTLDRSVRHLTGRGKALIAQWYASGAAERLRRTGMYMLVKNENSYLNIQAGDVSWWPEYEIDLGEQSPIPTHLDALRVAGSGWESLWRRDYAQGMVLCNTADTPISYGLPAGDWFEIETSGGGPVGQNGVPPPSVVSLSDAPSPVIVAASGCQIFSKTNTTANHEAGKKVEKFRAYTKASANLIQVELVLNEAGRGFFELCDASGRILQQFVAGELAAASHFIDLETCHLPAGIYVLRFKSRHYEAACKMCVY